MEYYDEQIVKALHIQRRDTFGSIDEGAVGKYAFLLPTELNKNILTNTRHFCFVTLSGYFIFL